MTTQPASPTQASATRPRLTLLPDPPKPWDMATQLPTIARVNMILQDRYLDRPDVLVSGEGYLCRDAADLRHAPRPDCLVAFNMPFPASEIIDSNGYNISEIGKPPDFVLEVASQSTGRYDATGKRDRYASYQVGEYWRFDRTGGRFTGAALAGDRLAAPSVYAEIPTERMPDGIIRGYSPSLGMELRWVDGQLYFWDPATRDYLSDLTEAKANALAERQARIAAEAQRDQVQAEVRRLQERLRQLEG